MTKLRVLLADDFPPFLVQVTQLLEPVFEVVEKVGDGQSLCEAAKRLNPDVIVTDFSMPILNGLDAVSKLEKSGCTSKIVFLTVNTDPGFVDACLAAGALGCVAKSRLGTDILPAIRTAMAGNIFVSPSLSPAKQTASDVPMARQL